MLIHITPTIYSLYASDTVSLSSVSVPQLDLNLKGCVDLALRKPYPNKRIQVACRRVGQKGASGILIKSPNFLDFYSTKVTWVLNNDIELEHVVNVSVLDKENDAVTDDPTLWGKCKIHVFNAGGQNHISHTHQLRYNRECLSHGQPAKTRDLAI